MNHAIILCGGRGRRILTLSDKTPKVLIPVGGKPILEHTIDLVKKFGAKDIILSVGYRKRNIIEHFGDGLAFDVNISYLEEVRPLGTAGPLRLASQKGMLPSDTFIMCNGDELKDIDIQTMLAFHKSNSGLATIALTHSADTSPFGAVEMEGRRIARFREKPRKGGSGLINAGFYIMEPPIINFVPKGKASLERDVFPKLARAGRLFGFPFEGQWFPADTPERLERARKEWKQIDLDLVNITGEV